MAADELRLGDIPGVTQKEKEGLEMAANVIADFVERKISKAFASKDDVDRLIQEAMKGMLQAKVPGNDAVKAKYEWAHEFFGAIFDNAPADKVRAINQKWSSHLKIGTGDTGMSYVLPSEVVNEVEEYARQRSWILDTVRAIPVKSMTGVFPVGTSTRPVTYIVSQLATPSASAPTMGGHSWGLLRFATFLPISRQLYDYSIPAFLRFLVEEMGYAYTAKVSAQFATGTNDSQWEGLETASITKVTANSSLPIDALVAAYYALPEQFRQNAIWVASSVTIGKIAALRDGNNQLIFPPTVPLEKIYGRPLYACDSLTNGKVYIGDPTRYHIYTGNTISVQQITTGYTPAVTDGVYLVANWDCDGGVSDVNAWRYFEIEV